MQRRNVAGRPEDQMAKILRSMQDDIDRLKSGSLLFGQVNVTQITIGGIVITVEDSGGASRTVIFTNPLNGATYTIPL